MTKRLRTLTDIEVRVLEAVNRYRFLKAAQLNRLLWPSNTRDRNHYAQMRLKILTDSGYLLRLLLPRPPVGTAPHVYALTRQGRRELVQRGVPVPDYFRPSETTAVVENPLFMPHTLAVTDVLIAAEQLADLFDTGLKLQTERELRRRALRVTVPGTDYQPARDVTVVPDAIFTLYVTGEMQHFVLELDRGTEHEPRWRNKVAALSYWLDSDASRDLISGDYVTVMVVTTTEDRRDSLLRWTEKELDTRGFSRQHANLFAISCESPVVLHPEEFLARRIGISPTALRQTP